jgi:hypothetical protein
MPADGWLADEHKSGRRPSSPSPSIIEMNELENDDRLVATFGLHSCLVGSAVG